MKEKKIYAQGSLLDRFRIGMIEPNNILKMPILLKFDFFQTGHIFKGI